MYAAAGGASLASRQARKKQAQQNTKNKATNQLILREKLAAKAATTPTKSKPFHQLPASYLRAPHQHHRKLSAGYTSIPGSDQPCTSGGVAGPHLGHHGHHQHHHHHQQQQQQQHPCHVHGPAHGGLATASGASFPPMPKPTGFREYDKLVRRQQLTKSATATLPLVSQAASDLTPPDTPTLGFGHHAHHHHLHAAVTVLDPTPEQQHQHQQHPNHHFYHYAQQQQLVGVTKRGSVPVAHSGICREVEDALTHPLTLQIPNPDPIVITPATPQATPPGRPTLKPLALTDDEEAHPLTSPEPGALERKCSVYRGRKLDPYEEQFYNTTTISGAGHQYHPDDVFFSPVGGGGTVPNGGGGHSTTTTTPGHQQAEYYCCECDHRQYGVCTCDQFE
ncbi:bromodomain-containing protein 4B-like, partial [Anopheles cruzii]|uniref:bromodomain-containing protein 4B-like n=1 Tax=Anopheles cruzii TaxID=68878 RepID=UPI0022EC8E11